MTASLTAALDEMRSGLAADGLDLEFVSLADGVATLRLIFAPDACEECVVPRAALETMLRSKLGARVPEVAAVTLLDPREA